MLLKFTGYTYHIGLPYLSLQVTTDFPLHFNFPHFFIVGQYTTDEKIFCVRE